MQFGRRNLGERISKKKTCPVEYLPHIDKGIDFTSWEQKESMQRLKMYRKVQSIILCQDDNFSMSQYKHKFRKLIAQEPKEELMVPDNSEVVSEQESSTQKIQEEENRNREDPDEALKFLQDFVEKQKQNKLQVKDQIDDVQLNSRVSTQDQSQQNNIENGAKSFYERNQLQSPRYLDMISSTFDKQNPNLMNNSYQNDCETSDLKRIQVRDYNQYMHSQYEDLFVNQSLNFEKQKGDDGMFDIRKHISSSVLSADTRLHVSDISVPKKVRRNVLKMSTTGSQLKNNFDQNNQKMQPKKFGESSVRINPNFKSSMGSFHKTPQATPKNHKNVKLNPLTQLDFQSSSIATSPRREFYDLASSMDFTRSNPISPRYLIPKGMRQDEFPVIRKKLQSSMNITGRFKDFKEKSRSEFISIQQIQVQ